MVKLAKFACAAFASAFFFAPPAVAGAIDVFVGYADSLRASGFFPTPWLGGAGVVSESNPVQPGEFDAGAVRIDNNTGSAITIQNFTVALNGGTVVFNFWAPLVIGAGETGIFTQTVAYNFDSSDFGFITTPGLGIDAAHPLGGCTNLGALNATDVAHCAAFAPKVTFDVLGGSSFSGLDTGHIIDTFGYDFVCCSSDGNESIAWRLIGTNAGRGGDAPEPPTALLFGAGLLAAGLLRRRQKQA